MNPPDENTNVEITSSYADPRRPPAKNAIAAGQRQILQILQRLQNLQPDQFTRNQVPRRNLFNPGAIPYASEGRAGYITVLQKTAVFHFSECPGRMKIRRAVITAAGEQHSRLPLQTLVDRRGESRPALRLTLDEIVEAGIEEIAIIVRPNQAEPYLSAAGPHASRLAFFEQHQPRGYGDAILRTREFIGDEPFLHLVSDHVYLSRSNRSCAAQLIEAASSCQCSVSAIQPTRENEVIFFGTVGGTPLARQDDLYEVTTVIEKPTPTVAEQHLIVAGQRSGYYLCLFGMHVLTPTVMRLLSAALDRAPAGESIDLTSSLNQLAQTERYLALEVHGTRYNISYKYGLLLAQLALALSGNDRDLILSELVTLLATGSTIPAT